jgi:hypothetical protein
MKSIHRAGLASALALVLFLADAGRAAAQAAPTPPPVSGRRLSDPTSILPADVLARVELLRANVELLRIFMGKPAAPAPLLRVEGAQPREVYSQALTLQLRANRLSFEQVRVVRSESVRLEQVARPADVFAVVDAALASILLVKQELGIDTVVAEQMRPESTTPSEVFNATVAAGSAIDHLMDQQTSPSQVFQLVTGAVYSAATLHAIIPNGPTLPDEPAFEANKSPFDVFQRMLRCYVLIRELADTAAGMDTLRFEVDPDQMTAVAPDDVEDLAALILEQLDAVHRAFPAASSQNRAYYPGRRFPAHVYQRAGLLEQILDDLAVASRSGRLRTKQGG